MIPYGRQDVNDFDVEAVVDALRSDLITQGEQVPGFEQSLVKYTGARHAVVANSATSSLHLACMALELGPGDILWAPPITFVASTNCALYCGASVDFVDIDPLTANISVAALDNKLKSAETDGVLPKVLVVVHMAGNPCDLRELSRLCDRYGVAIIEDASHAIGARYQDQPVGDCRFSKITVFSFHPVKIITTAEGGAATTNDSELAHRMALYRSHGITRDQDLMHGPPDGGWYYQQLGLGYNYRMTELQAALGISQMNRLDEFVERRNHLANAYDTAFKLLDVTPVFPAKHVRSSFHLYIILLDPATTLAYKREVYNAMRDAGIGVNVHYIPVPAQPYYAEMGHNVDDYPGACEYYRRALSLPLFPTLDEKSQRTVVDALSMALPNS